MMGVTTKHSTKQRNTSGDTIVEVLISVTIISFVLGAAYLLTSHSLQAGIAAREHTEALNYIQGQIERLKSAKETTVSGIFDTTYLNAPGPYCLVVDGANNVSAKPAGQPECFVDSSNTTNGRYHLSTTYYDASRPNNPKTFKFSAVWDRIGGNNSGQESADIYYRTTND